MNYNRQKVLEALMTMLKFWVVCLCLTLIQPVYAEEADHEGTAIELSAEEQRAAGIVIGTVEPRALNETLRIPGEVVINAYRSVLVTPRITAQVVARHAKLGAEVEVGQPLVALSSVEMAEAQGTLIVANREWQRVKTLGRQAVSEQRYTEAQVAQQHALAKVLAYGMTMAQAEALMQSGDASKATGTFDLLAPQAGTVLQDDFIVGELIEPGRVLISISDESVMWVKAHMVLTASPKIGIGANVRIIPDGINWFPGTVIQLHHHLDEKVRTQGLRIEVPNTSHSLHSGQFVEVEVVTGMRAPELAVPNAALIMIKGSPNVFKIEEGHEFHAEAIEVGSTVGEWTVVRGGLVAGDEIAVSGVFHLKSLMLKSSLGAGHAH